MNDKTDDQVKEEIRDKVENKEPEGELSIEEQATALGWHADGKNIHGETVSPERFIQEKPLYDTLEKHKKTFKRLDDQILELQSDNKKIAAASIKEKEALLAQLAQKKDAALDNMEVDEVRKIDKQIDGVRDEIAAAPTDNVSPYWGAFVEENDWANDEDDPRTLASEGIVRRYKTAHPDAGDKDLYDNLHKTIREKFPEKFEEKKPQQKVASANKRVTDNKNKRIVTGKLQISQETSH